jgi:hypothetical protein
MSPWLSVFEREEQDKETITKEYLEFYPVPLGEALVLTESGKPPKRNKT